MIQTNFLTACLLKYFGFLKVEESWKPKESKYKDTDQLGLIRYPEISKNLKKVLRKCLIIYHPYTNYIWYELRAMALPFRISMIFKFAFETPVIFIIINSISLSPKVWPSTTKPYLYPQLTQLIWEEYKNMGVDKINYWKFMIVKCSLEKLFLNIVKWPFKLRFLTFLRRNIFI